MSNRLGPRTRLLGAGEFARVGQWFQRSRVKSIQRATIAITGGTSNTATVTAVVMANSRLRLLGRIYNNAAGGASQSHARIAFTNSTTITASVIDTTGVDTLTVSFELIEYYPGVIKSVQRGTVTQAAGTATITAVNTAKSELDYLGETATTVAASSSATALVVLTNSTTVTVTGGTANGQTAGFQVIEWY